jgi:peptidoglycan/LPS O-acetylase OafA/YrhL
VLSVLHLANVPHFVVSPQTGGLGRALLAALTLHINWLEATRGYLPGSWDILWSLSIEEMFYLFFPLVCKTLGKEKGLIALLLVFVALGPFGRTLFTHGNEVWQEYSYLGGMDAIALGCLTALFVARRRVSRVALVTSFCMGMAILIFTLCFSTFASARALDRIGLGMTLVATGTCLVIASIAQTGAQARSTVSHLLAPLAWLGQRSYEIYLTHMFVVIAVFQLFLALGKPIRGVPLLFASVILVAALLGVAVARCYSEPLNRMLRGRWKDPA